MSATRKTVDRETIADRANSMIAHLAESGTQTDKVRREAIIAVTSSILLAGNSYKGFTHLNRPVVGKDNSTYWDDSRIKFH